MPSRLRLGREEYKALCLKVMQRDKWRCRACLKRTGIHVHHVRFRSEGGSDSSDNLVCLCGGPGQPNCHDAVHGLIPGFYIIILPKSGDPQDELDCDEGVSFIKYGKIRKRVKLKPKK